MGDVGHNKYCTHVMDERQDKQLMVGRLGARRTYGYGCKDDEEHGRQVMLEQLERLGMVMTGSA